VTIDQLDDNFYISMKGYIATFLALQGSTAPHETNSILQSPFGDHGNSCNVPVARCPYCKSPDAGIVSWMPDRPQQTVA